MGYFYNWRSLICLKLEIEIWDVNLLINPNLELVDLLCLMLDGYFKKADNVCTVVIDCKQKRI